MDPLPRLPDATALANDRVRPWLQMADRESITRYQQNRLRTGLARIVPTNSFLQGKLSGFDLRALAEPDGDAGGTTLPVFQSLPFTSKQELVDDQLGHPPFGTNLSNPLQDYIRLHQTSGTTGSPL